MRTGHYCSTLVLLLLSVSISETIKHKKSESASLSCPSNQHCGETRPSKTNSSSVHNIRDFIGNRQTARCPVGTYSLGGWNKRCCSVADATECGKRAPGNWAFNSTCQCHPITCKSSSEASLEPMKSFSGGGGVEQIICYMPTTTCQNNKPCASPSMVREPHTCNCLQITYPCESKEEVLLGNIGGPYQCVELGAQNET